MMKAVRVSKTLFFCFCLVFSCSVLSALAAPHAGYQRPSSASRVREAQAAVRGSVASRQLELAKLRGVNVREAARAGSPPGSPH
jgi:hypothetical protein